MGSQEQDDQASQRVCAELQSLREGLADTSTLIYLDALGIVPRIGQWLHIALIPQVVSEFGHHPTGMELVPSAEAVTVDEAVIQTAAALALPIFSEDGRILRQARKMQHPHYNSLMLLLALYAQGIVPQAQLSRLRLHLLSYARYSEEVVAYADRVLHRLLAT